MHNLSEIFEKRIKNVKENIKISNEMLKMGRNLKNIEIMRYKK